MLYLAQVEIDPDSGKMQLQVLARQESEYVWSLDHSQKILLTRESSLCAGGTGAGRNRRRTADN